LEVRSGGWSVAGKAAHFSKSQITGKNLLPVFCAPSRHVLPTPSPLPKPNRLATQPLCPHFPFHPHSPSKPHITQQSPSADFPKTNFQFSVFSSSTPPRPQLSHSPSLSHYMITAISAVSITIFWLGLQLDFPSISLPKTVLLWKPAKEPPFQICKNCQLEANLRWGHDVEPVHKYSGA